MMLKKTQKFCAVLQKLTLAFQGEILQFLCYITITVWKFINATCIYIVSDYYEPLVTLLAKQNDINVNFLDKHHLREHTKLDSLCT